MENGKTPKSVRSRAGMRNRLSQASELQTLPPETLERLLNLPDRLKRAARRTTNALGEQRQTLAETERRLAYTIDQLRRQADRIAWIQTGVIVLALIAGTLGGAAAALVILSWMP